MLEIGSVLRASIVRVEPYGIYLQHGDKTIIVLAPDSSWTGKGDLRGRFQVGDSLDVLILRFNYAKREYVGSIRHLHPEENPYRHLSRLQPGTVLTAKVRHTAAGEVTVELPNGAWGHVPSRLLPTEAKPGDRIEVVITGLEVDEGRLWLEPARPAVNGTNGPAVSPAAVAKV